MKASDIIGEWVTITRPAPQDEGEGIRSLRIAARRRNGREVRAYQ